MGEEAPMSGNIKLFFKGDDIGGTRSFGIGATNFDTIFDFLTGCC